MNEWTPIHNKWDLGRDRVPGRWDVMVLFSLEMTILIHTYIWASRSNMISHFFSGQVHWNTEFLSLVPFTDHCIQLFLLTWKWKGKANGFHAHAVIPSPWMFPIKSLHTPSRRHHYMFSKRHFNSIFFILNKHRPHRTKIKQMTIPVLKW